MADNKTDIQRELEELELEEKKLRVENLKYQIENERERRAAILRAHQVQQMSLDQANRDIAAQQEQCKHKKGGKGLEGILNGHDPNYSVIKHTYPAGEVRVHCTRCNKEWARPTEEQKASLSKKEYADLLKEYKDALAFPTDNEASGTQLFVITKGRAA